MTTLLDLNLATLPRLSKPKYFQQLIKFSPIYAGAHDLLGVVVTMSGGHESSVSIIFKYETLSIYANPSWWLNLLSVFLNGLILSRFWRLDVLEVIQNRNFRGFHLASQIAPLITCFGVFENIKILKMAIISPSLWSISTKVAYLFYLTSYF